MKKVIGILFTIIFVLSIVFTIFFYKKYDELLNVVKSLEFQNHFYVDGDEVIDDLIVKKDEKVYLEYSLIKKYIDSEIKLSNSKSRIYFKIKNYSTGINEIDKFIYKNMDTFNLPTMQTNNKYYVSLDILKKLYPIEFMEFKESGNKYIFVNSIKVGKISSKTSVYSNVNGYEFVVSKLKVNDKVRIMPSETGINVIDNQGYIGYIDEKNMSTIETIKIEIGDNSYNPIIKNNLENINLIWDQVSTFSKNNNDIDVSYLNSIDAIAPVWFELNVEGIVLNESSIDYVNWIHKNNKMVWGTFNNSFNRDWTSNLFKNEEHSNRAIAQILFYSSFYKLDGINIDFENMNLVDKDNYVEFVRNLTSKLKIMNLYTSLDVTIPGGSDTWSKVYDRMNLSKYVDFIMLMAYDEYWASSKVAGSVSSKEWAEKGILNTLKEVPKEKLVLGIPLYTRIWEETKNSSGKITAKSKTLSVKNTKKYIKDNNIKIVYDEKTSQNYGEYFKDGKKIRIWFEDKVSSNMRKNLQKKYDLSGFAFWSIEFIDENSWNEMYGTK